MTTPSTQTSLQRFLGIMAKLRNPQGGCPWDLKQTFDSLKPLLIEEAYEVSEAVEKGPEHLKEELGDIISLIGLFAQIAAEKGLFSFDTILEGISDKLVRRHPHVFGEVKVTDTTEVLKNWEEIKGQERQQERISPGGLLDGIPRSLPALQKSQQIGERCSRVGFDWTSSTAVTEKIREEVSEFIREAQQREKAVEQSAKADFSANMFEELGDLLFSLAQYSRHLGFSPEQALQAANDKFCRRFKVLESLASQQEPAKPLSDLGSERLEKLWEQAKKSAPPI